MYSRSQHFLLSNRHTLFWAIAVALLIGGCHKEKCDTNPPVIRFLEPTANSTFYYLETFAVKADVADDRILKKVLLEVNSASNQRYLQSQTMYPNTQQTSIQLPVVHDDLYLESGTYYIKITADDGENESIAFREIQLIAAPRTLDRVGIVRLE
ncbi:MAG: hypothetical protein ACKO7B_07065, partial [Flavobacteriales bacterium]